MQVTMAEIAPIQVRWFADYHAINPNWGVFHVSLGDGNYDTGAQELDDFRRGEATPAVLAPGSPSCGTWARCTSPRRACAASPAAWP